MKKFSFKKALVAGVVAISMTLAQIPAAFAAQPVDPKYTWNLSEIFSNTDAFNKACDKVEKEYIPTIISYKDNLTDTGKIYKMFRAWDTADRLMEKIYIYAMFSKDLDITSEDALNLVAKCQDVLANLNSAESYIQPQLLKLSDETLTYYINNPIMKDFSQLLKDLLRQKQHILSEKEENILSATQPICGEFSSIWDNINRGDFTAPTYTDETGKTVTVGSLVPTIFPDPNADRALKQKLYDLIYNNIGKNKNTLAAVMNAEVNKNVILAKIRNYNSGLEAALASENIPTDVYNNLIKSVNNNLKYLHKLNSIKKKYLVKSGQIKPEDKMHHFDLYYFSMVDDSILDKMKFPFEKAKETILDGLKPLGEDYINNLKTAFDNRWIDVYPAAHKDTGAYSMTIYDMHPFVLLNYNDTIDDMLTCSHELGHAMNGVYTNRTQPYKKAGGTLFTAEVASTANELLMSDYMINKVQNDEEKLYLINTLAENISSTIYFQVLLTEFEKMMYEKVEKGEALSANFLNNTWKEIFQRYYGPDYVVDDSYGIYWARISHYYRNFYTYKYATAMSAAFELTKQMREDKTGEATKRYIEFLSAGQSDFSIDLIKKAGVDMTQTTAVDNLLEYMGKLVDEEEALLKKMGKID